MKAIVIDEYGGREKLKETEMPIPEPGDDDVLIEIHAASINPVDWKVREGYLKEMLPHEFPLVLGYDAAGVVIKTGANVSKFKEGDEVYTRPDIMRNGTYAEYVAVAEDLVALKPENLSFEEAASIPLVGETSWQALVEFAGIKKGDKVFVPAGAGGVGSFAIQLAKSFGATAASTASGKNIDLLKDLGADEAINYKEDDFETRLSGYDIVFDTLGGDNLRKSYEIMKEGGTVISIVEEPDEAFASEKGIKTGFLFLEPSGEQLGELTKRIESGEIRPLTGETFPLSEEGLKAAHELSETHHARGKIIIKVK